MTGHPSIASIATAVPHHVLGRDEVAEMARQLFGDEAADRLLPIYVNSGIERRHSCVPIEWYARPSGWAASNRIYLDAALGMMERAVADCLEAVDATPRDVDIVVAVSTSGIATPSLDALLMDRMDMRRDVQRLPIFGLGCAGGVLGLARAAAMARANPGASVLLAVVETCGLTFRPGDHSKSNLVATALFGDGAAALLLREGHGPRIVASGEYTWPDSLDVMGWRVEDDGFGVLFSRDIPTLVRAGFRPAAEAFLARHGLRLDDIDGYLCHPGGAKVVTALEEALDLAPGTLVAERGILRDYGNMSAATVLFVIERALPSLAPGRYLATALGPGFTAGFLLLEV